MTTFTLTVEQIKEIFYEGLLTGVELEGEDVGFPERLALLMQEYLNEGVSVHSKEYRHMTDVIEIMKL